MKYSIPLEINREPFAYRIDIGDSILDDIASSIPKNTSQIIIISHEHLYRSYGELINKSLKKAGHKTIKYIIPIGEKVKNWNTARDVLSFLIKNNIDRASLIIALGGGVIGDLAGFVASIFCRGIPFIQIPTTLLAMVDSSVGGKTAVNLDGLGKNLIGSFYQPSQVIIDLNTLETLPDDEWRNGMAEVLKYAFIREDNKEFYNWLLANRLPILAKDKSIVAKMIEYSVSTKASIVKQDETERTGRRALLNFGHTFGHTLEVMSKYTMSHGKAVSIGMVLASRFSSYLGRIDNDTNYELIDLLSLFALPIDMPKDCSTKDMYRLFRYDKKTENNRLHFVLPVGNATSQVVAVGDKEISGFLEGL